MVAVLAVSSNGALISVYNTYIHYYSLHRKKAIDTKPRVCHYPSSITGADAMQTNEINSPEIKNHKKKEWSSLKLAGAVLRIDRGPMTIPIRHGVGDWPFHWPGWSIRSSRSGLHGRSLVSYGNVDYHLGRSRSGGSAASGYYLCPGSASVTWAPPHLTHGPMNRRCRSSGDVARELVDRLPTPPRQGRYTVCTTNYISY